MAEPSGRYDPAHLPDWWREIDNAHRNNILCHCRECDRQWVDSTFDAACQCGSRNVERISCWQFPDD
ncbi:MAG: hypothetical protein IGR76_07780 [Synechococcales cyanobacterium T60_A2020_003]|nr:hypothetical protein [Synechococcales cyanobacterium T60_A2020_003]